MTDDLDKIVRAEKYTNKKVNTIIGQNTIFRGNFIVEGPLRIDGNYEGDIKSYDMVIVGLTGKVKGEHIWRNSNSRRRSKR